MPKYEIEGNMSKEKKGNDLFREGRQNVLIQDMTLETSKKGNRMFKLSLRSLTNDAEGDFYAVFEIGKRWLLHSLLEALKLYKKDENNQYVIDTDEIIGKTVCAEFKTVEEDWVNSKAETVKVKKSQIAKFYPPLKFEGGKKEDADEEIPF
jgi:hypothetical protein